MNHLENESSPYLRQHADNPVDWYPWGETALAKARREDKPIVVSIGYSTCHWCHVMERESFVDEDVAAFMNEHFVSIKIDREERPDLDALYMDACQIIAGTSGWPLHVFLTPELKPFYSGTYFPPEAGHKRQSWFQALQYVLYNFRQNRKAVEAQADRILARMKMAESGLGDPPEMEEKDGIFTRQFLEKIYVSLRQKFDEEEGGFGTGQKFPNTMALEFLLQYFALTNEKEALAHFRFSLNKMMDGGIYDQVGGGIARYAVDRKWQVPHFEKMLYDNALFVQLLAKAHRLTGRRKYKTAFTQSIRFLEREMRSPDGGFFSALDADSEGGEGRFYTWKKSEIEEVLGEDTELFCSFFGITEKGNWEGTNILRQPHERFDFSEKNGYEREDFRNKILDLVEQVLAARQKRKAPHRDEKIILGWNALMVSAYVDLYAAVGEEKYRESAEQLLGFLWQNFVEDEGKTLHRTLTDGRLSNPATLQDHAFFIRAMLDVFQINFKEKWLERAGQLTEAVFGKFREEGSVLFNFSPTKNTDLVLGQKDIKDDDMPSGNAMMVRNLQDLGILLGREEWRKTAAQMLAIMRSKTEANPLAHAAWASAFLAETEGVLEVAIIGDEAEAWAKEMRRGFVPFQVVMASTQENDKHPLLAGKPKGENTLIYVCRDYACQRPLEAPTAFHEQFSKLHILSSKR